jgi:hypothetical protein
MKVFRWLAEVCLVTMILHAGSAVVSWGVNTETDLAGYKVYWGMASGNYANVSDVGLNTSKQIDSLADGTTHFFAVKAYDTSANESEFSTEVSLTLPPPQTSGPAVTLNDTSGRTLNLTRKGGNTNSVLSLTVNTNDCVTFNGVKFAGGLNCP